MTPTSRPLVLLLGGSVVVTVGWAALFTASILGLVDVDPAVNAAFIALQGALLALYNPSTRERVADAGRELRAYLTHADRTWLRSHGWTDEDESR